MRTPWLKIGCVILIITIIAITLADGKKSRKDTVSSKEDKSKDKDKLSNPKNKPVLNKKKTEKKSKDGEQEVLILKEDRQEIIVAQERIEPPEVSNTVVNGQADKPHGHGCPHRAAKLDQVGEIEKNVTALWSQVNALSQPVHIHVHGSRARTPGRHSQHWDKDGQQGQEWAEKGRSAGPYIPRHGDKVKTHSHGNRSHTEGHHDHSRHHHHHDRSHHHHHHRDHSKGHSHGNHSHSHNHTHDHSHHDHSHKIHDYTHQHHDRSNRGRHHDFRGHGHREHSFSKKRDYDRRDGGRSTHVHIHLTIDDKPEHPPTSEHPPKESVNNVSAYARCDLRNSDSNTHLVGYALLRQKAAQDLEVKINISGFLIPPPNPDIEQSETSGVTHLHGFHVHEFADFSKGCLSFGGHYNPEGHDHGGLAHDVRHVGDWGNIEVNEDGEVVTYISVSDASLKGPHSILGRGIVVHAGADDLGEAGTEVSRASGSAGARLACCIIGSSKPVPDDEW